MIRTCRRCHKALDDDDGQMPPDALCECPGGPPEDDDE